MQQKFVYLDQAAAARPDPEVLKFYFSILPEAFVNQEAAHDAGYQLRRRLERAAESVAALAGDEFRVVWGNSGSELFNLLADSGAVAGKKVATSKLEHPALLANLTRCAAEVRFCRVDGVGRIITPLPEAEVLALHLVQSELGVRQDFETLIREFRSSVPGGTVFCDAIQAAGKMALPVAADLIAVSGHKFGAPGGAALLIRQTWRGARALEEFAHAYRHRDYRCGRPEPAVLLAMAHAADLCRHSHTQAWEKISRLNGLLRKGVAELDCRCTVPSESASPYILHLLLPGFQSGVLVRMLAAEGVMVAAGSACASETREPSAALTAIGLRRQEAFSGLRVSMGMDSSESDVKIFLDVLKRVLKNY